MWIVSPVSGTVSVPFPMNVAILCVWFIGVTLVFVAISSQTGRGDNSNADVAIVVVVVLPVVEADNAVVVNAKIIANVKVVAAVARYALGSRDILVIPLFIVFILRAPWDGNQRIKEFSQGREKSAPKKFYDKR
jgi:hypothetical protein